MRIGGSAVTGTRISHAEYPLQLEKEQILLPILIILREQTSRIISVPRVSWSWASMLETRGRGVGETDNLQAYLVLLFFTLLHFADTILFRFALN